MSTEPVACCPWCGLKDTEAGLREHEPKCHDAPKKFTEILCECGHTKSQHPTGQTKGRICDYAGYSCKCKGFKAFVGSGEPIGSEKASPCQICGQVFFGFRALNGHMSAHTTAEKSKIYDQCGEGEGAQ